MAVEKAILIPELGVTAMYHRIIGFDVTHIPETDVEGCKGSAYIRVASYASKDVRDAGGRELRVSDFRFRYGESVATVTNRGKPVAVILTAEPTRPEVYAAFSQLPMFEDATEA